MRYLRTNTAIRITVGPFFDNADGVTPETAITVTNEKLTFLVDDANVPTLVLDTAPTASGGNNDMVHITGDDAGFYDLELTAANVNYLGRAMLSLTNAAVHVPVFHEFMILPANVYDSFVLGTDNLQVDSVQQNGTNLTARDIGASVLLSSGTGTGQVSLSSGAVTVGTNSDKTGYSLSSAAIQAIWDALTSALITVGSIGKLIADNINATISSRASQTSVDDLPTNAELATALSGADDATLAAIAALDIPTATENAAEILSAAEATPIHANAKQVNDTNLTGDGSTTPWGPA